MDQQVSLVTEAARASLLNRIAQLGMDISLHKAKGLDGHDTHVILNEPFLDNNGAVVSSKTLKIGVVVDGVNAYALIPAFTT